MKFVKMLCLNLFSYTVLPARASKQGKVIGLVSIYIYICVYVQKNVGVGRIFERGVTLANQN